MVASAKSISEMLDPSVDKMQRMMSFFALGESPGSSPASRPTLYGLTTSKDSVSAFVKLVKKTEEVRKILVDALERQEIRSRILEPNNGLYIPGAFQDRA